MLSVIAFFVLMLGGGDAMAMAASSMQTPPDDEVPDNETLKKMSVVDRNAWIERVAAKLMTLEYDREILSLQLKRLFLAGSFLHENDKFVDVKSSI